MRKFFVALLAGAVAVGLAAPAFAADLKFTGGYRFRFQFDENLPCMTEQAGTDCSGHEFQARFAPRFDVETEGGVRGVIRLEIGDLRFGSIAKGTDSGAPAHAAGAADPGAAANSSRQSVGGAGNDAVNVETKWAYIDFPVPASPLRLRAGLQPIVISKELFLGEDVPGVSIYGKLGEINTNAFWVRGNSTVAVDATGMNARDIYGLDLTFSPMKDLSLNAYLVYDHDMENVLTVAPIGESTTGFWFGVGGAGKVQNIRWDLDFVYGTKELPTGFDQKGWMVDGGAGMAVAGTPLDLEVRGWWATGADGSPGDSDAFPVLIGPDHNAGGTNVWGAGQDSDIDALAANAQNTWGIGLIARYTVSPTLKIAGNVHYIGTVEEGIATSPSLAGGGSISGVDSIGTEVAVKADYTIAKGLVFTLTLGHLFLGDDLSVDGTTRFDDVTKLFGVVNYGF